MDILKLMRLCSKHNIPQVASQRLYRGSRTFKFKDSDFKDIDENKLNTKKTLIKTDIYHKDKDLEKELEERFKLSGKTHPNSDLDHWLEFPSDTLIFRDQLKQREKLNKLRDQSTKSFRPKTDPRDTSILMFPGQGSQFVGMATQLLQYPKVEDLFKLASKILGFDLLSVCLQGPKNLLDKTSYCQPAVLVTSLAALEKLKHHKPWAIERCISAAGYSVGEISALVFAGVISFEDAIHLVKARSEAMQKASEEVKGGMLTIFTSPDSKLKFACSAAKKYCQEELGIENSVCCISNYLHPSCKVVAGNIEALDFLVRNSKEFHIHRARYLPVSGAFHTPLMYQAAQSFSEKLGAIKFNEPIIPVHSNVSGYRFINAEHVKKMMVRQIYSAVKWEQTMHCLFSRPQKNHFPAVFEVGPGKQLGSLLKMVNNQAHAEYECVEV